MFYAGKFWTYRTGAVATASVFSAAAGAARAQVVGPRDYFEQAGRTYGARVYEDRWEGQAIRDRRAARIEELSRPRARGEDVEIYDRTADRDRRRSDYRPLPPPPREYAELYDSRNYHRDAAEAPSADDQRPLRAPACGHYDGRQLVVAGGPSPASSPGEGARSYKGRQFSFGLLPPPFLGRFF